MQSQWTRQTSPTFCFIFADDWGWGDLSCHGHPYVKTPNIDRLAKEGTDFHRFTVASGVCSPSRTAVMTGHFPARYNIDGHFAWVPSNAKRNMPDWLSPKAPLLPRFLQQAGYATAHFGKWHLSNNMIPDSPLPSEYGYDEYGAFNCAGEQMPVHEDARNAIAFIEKSHREKKPFFINLWIHEPHTPFHTVPKYRWRFRDLEERDNIYASVLSHADDRIGEVLDTLDRLKLTDNTLVIFSSDNGPARAAGPTELDADARHGHRRRLRNRRRQRNHRRPKRLQGRALRRRHRRSLHRPLAGQDRGRQGRQVVADLRRRSAADILRNRRRQTAGDYQPDGVSQVDALHGQRLSQYAQKPLFWKMRSAWPIRKTQPYHWVSYAVVHENWKLLTNRDSSYVGTLRPRRRSLREDRPEGEEARSRPPTNAAARSVESDATSRTNRRRFFEAKERDKPATER